MAIYRGSLTREAPGRAHACAPSMASCGPKGIPLAFIKVLIWSFLRNPGRPMYYGAVIHYRRSRLLNSSTLSLIGVASNLSDGSSRGPRQDNRAVKSAFLSETAIWMQKTENPHFLKSDELWSTCFNTVGMHSGRATRNQKFVGQSSKTAEIWR